MENKKEKKIVILGGGGSLEQYLQQQLLPKEQNPIYGAEIWAINFVGLTVKCDKIIAMDHLHTWPLDKLERLLAEKHTVITCKKPTWIPLDVIEYPLKEVIEHFNGFQYFNTTVAYAVALAIYEGATSIGLYGIDFTWPGERNLAEAGRACVEFWLAIAVFSAGISINLPATTTLLDQYNERKLYGYV